MGFFLSFFKKLRHAETNYCISFLEARGKNVATCAPPIYVSFGPIYYHGSFDSLRVFPRVSYNPFQYIINFFQKNEKKSSLATVNLLAFGRYHQLAHNGLRPVYFAAADRSRSPPADRSRRHWCGRGPPWTSAADRVQQKCGGAS
jgi:hypothetical protein